MVEYSCDDVCNEERYRQEGVHIVTWEGISEEIQSCKHSVPADQRVYAVDQEDYDCGGPLYLLHCISIYNNG